MPESRQLGRLSGRRRARLRIRDPRIREGYRARGTRQRHLGLRGAAERERGRHQPALALDHDPDHGHDHGRDLPAQGAGRRLRRRQGLRVPVRRARDTDHRRGRLAGQSAGDQVTQSAEARMFAASVSHLRVRHGHEHHRVTYVELFFDLVFVFAVTQLSHGLLKHLTPLGAVQTALLMLAVWWVWIYTTWFTNWTDPERPAVRLMLGAMM